MYLVDVQGQILKGFPPIHDATTGDDDEVFELLACYVNQFDLSVLERVVVCGDGARWIWLRVEALLKDRGVAPEKVYQVMDYTHAKQNLQEIVDLVPPKKQKRIMKKWKTFLFKGDITGLGHAIRSVLRGKKREAGLKKWEDYFVRNAQRMRYQYFKEHHLPCGSGHVESAIRRVINLRLKAPGTFWTQDMAEYFLFLRSQLLSGRWKIFMKNVRRRVTSFGEKVGEINLQHFENAPVLRESLELRQTMYLFRRAEPLTNIADVYYHQDKLTEAMTACEESLALSRQYGGRIQAGKTLHLMAKICLKEQHYDEALQYVREAADIFKDTGSRHLPEAEATLKELQGLRISKD
jgi:tetratricopeptide (TPR) repeat protein